MGAMAVEKNLALPPDELKRRIHAARVLRGVTQEKLEEQLAEQGLGKREAGRVERGEISFQRVHRLMFADALRVPERWFTAGTVDEIVGFASRSET